MTTNRLPTWTATWRLIRFRPRSYLTFSLLYLVTLGSRAIPGLVLQAFFNRLTGSATVGFDIWTLLGVLLATEATRITLDFVRTFSEESFRVYAWALLRRNILANVLRRPGADPLPIAPGDAANRLQNDVTEFSDWPSWLPYVAGQALFAVIALVNMVRIDPWITAAALIPLAGVVVIVKAARDRLLHHDQVHREASSRITGFLGEVLDGIAAVKAAVAEEDIVVRLKSLDEVRRNANTRFEVFWALLNWAHSSIADLTLGLVLLLVAQALQRGSFTVGDFALFVSYVRIFVDFPGTLGGFMADYRTQALSINRLLELQPDATPESLVAAAPVYLSGPAPAIPPLAPPSVPLQTLTAEGLTYHYPGSSRGIEDISLAVRRGEFVVITGRIGSGKTTLLRVLLGLLPIEHGEIRWNGAAIEDPASFFRSPYSAYTPQVPRLFSDPLRDNLTMGLPVTAQDLDEAIHISVLEPDLVTLENGLDTLVGPRGVRLSGGQVQRAAAARMFLRRPQLLVLDDISSALDVTTELSLWQRIFELEGATCLAVSHRPLALQRADRIIVLDQGRVEATGTLTDLLQRSPTLQEIWEHGTVTVDTPGRLHAKHPAKQP